TGTVEAVATTQRGVSVQLVCHVRGQEGAVAFPFLWVWESTRPDAYLEAAVRQGVIDRVLRLGSAQVQDVAVSIDRRELSGQGQQMLTLAYGQAVLRGFNVVWDQQVSAATLKVPGDTDTGDRGRLVNTLQDVVHVEGV